ncbi:hypothetical protein CXG81DRAFT_23887 [Caulochytrium protostelioides]|uniref:protein xylosyltransferase n=1 Tax=Caulochytrium protostelioides TaxID=1555241 RepID=A0A4P9XEB6_9FUNG|nr:hypothetical protein CXG81DRAFT_23887 [Caulochytrium protostelioides]|eukprot:RKP03491.1 hypothetical protein CXG81DRAFT_23887 [Caulochytrium protostelioides]
MRLLVLPRRRGWVSNTIMATAAVLVLLALYTARRLTRGAVGDWASALRASPVGSLALSTSAAARLPRITPLLVANIDDGVDLDMDDVDDAAYVDHHADASESDSVPAAAAGNSTMTAADAGFVSGVLPRVVRLAGFATCAMLDLATFETRVPLYALHGQSMAQWYAQQMAYYGQYAVKPPLATFVAPSQRIAPATQLAGMMVRLIDRRAQKTADHLRRTVGYRSLRLHGPSLMRYACYMSALGDSTESDLSVGTWLRDVFAPVYWPQLAWLPPARRDPLQPAAGPNAAWQNVTWQDDRDRYPTLYAPQADLAAIAGSHGNAALAASASASTVAGAKPSYRLAYVILAHENFPALLRLVNAIEHPQAVVMVHVDARAAAVRAQVEALAASRPNLIVMPESFQVAWGSSTIVQVQLQAFFRLMDLCTFDHVMNLSVYDYPLLSTAAIIRRLADWTYRTDDAVQTFATGHPDAENARDTALPRAPSAPTTAPASLTPPRTPLAPIGPKSFICHWQAQAEVAMRLGQAMLPLEDYSRIEYVHDRTLPPRIYNGFRYRKHDQWMVLSRGFLERLRRSRDALALLTWGEHAFVLDESYFAVWMMHGHPTGPPPGRIGRVIDHVTNAWFRRARTRREDTELDAKLSHWPLPAGDRRRPQPPQPDAAAADAAPSPPTSSLPSPGSPRSEAPPSEPPSSEAPLSEPLASSQEYVVNTCFRFLHFSPAAEHPDWLSLKQLQRVVDATPEHYWFARKVKSDADATVAWMDAHRAEIDARDAGPPSPGAATAASPPIPAAALEHAASVEAYATS